MERKRGGGGAGWRDNSGREQFSEQDDHELLDRL